MKELGCNIQERYYIVQGVCIQYRCCLKYCSLSHYLNPLTIYLEIQAIQRMILGIEKTLLALFE